MHGYTVPTNGEYKVAKWCGFEGISWFSTTSDVADFSLLRGSEESTLVSAAMTASDAFQTQSSSLITMHLTESFSLFSFPVRDLCA